MENINLKIEKGEGEIVIREGQALPLNHPNKVSITGDINTVTSFVSKRYFKEEIDGTVAGRQDVYEDKAIVTVDKNTLSITLDLDPEEHFGATVKGQLQYSDEVKAFGINENKTMTREQLIKLLKFSRLHFTDRDKHAELLNAFEKFSATANFDIKKESDDRGNKIAAMEKQVKTNLPLNFILNIPIFKGQPKETFRVEICFDVTEGSIRFWFESVELHELLETRRDEIFSSITEPLKDFVIIYK